VGTSLRKDEYVGDVSDIDDIIVFTKAGNMMVTKVDSKTFVGKNIIHVAVFKKKDKRTIYNLIYRDGKSGPSYIKRFAVTSITRDKEYSIGYGNAGTLVHYFSANANGEAEVVTVNLRQQGTIRKLRWDLDFSDIAIKGRSVRGNLVTKYSVKRVELKEEGVSTLKPRKIWFDDTVQRLNVDGRGELLGEFKGEDRLLIADQSGVIKTVIPEVTLRFEPSMVLLEKWQPERPISVIYFHGEKQLYYIKRFLIENPDKEESVIPEYEGTRLEHITTGNNPVAELTFAKPRGKEQPSNEEIDLNEFIAVKGITAQGNILSKKKIKNIDIHIQEEPEAEIEPVIEVVDKPVQAEQKDKGNAQGSLFD
jgi:topoisomerase-4 subunit A